MADTINVKDIVIVKITKDVKKNDIISYEDNNLIITHRVIEESGDYLITKGDANNSIDKPVSRDQVVGKVAFIIPKIAVWEKVFTSPQVLISGSVTIILMYFLITSDDKRKDKNV